VNPKYAWLGGKQRSADALGGVVLMGVRLYNPVTGRFLTVDPIYGRSDNSYEYAGGDPVNRVDLDGRAWKCHCKCHLVCNGQTQRFIFGVGKAETQAEAGVGRRTVIDGSHAAAYKRHCKCSCTRNRLKQRLHLDSDADYRARNLSLRKSIRYHMLGGNGPWYIRVLRVGGRVVR